MLKTALVGMLCAFIALFWPRPALAIVDPLSTPNNKFGIHIVDDNDLEPAAALVNSTGGEWGYVTVVIREDDRDIAKWQKTFDKMRQLKLIPLVRLATTSSRGVWLTPSEEDMDSWVYFLNSLNWVTQNRYVIIFNEPNHAQEWGGRIDPVGYATTLRRFHDRLKEASPDFFILPAGFDSAAGNTKDTMDMATYLATMYAADNKLFSDLDGWTSHSYPNPGFAGKPTDTGKGTVKSYLWELAFLEKYGVRPNLPVFITETGWLWDGNPVSLAKLSENYRKAFSDVWTEGTIVAITPFILNYQAAPFDKFSWTQKGKPDFYPYYGLVQSLPKTAGRPAQIDRAEFIPESLPERLITDSHYALPLRFKNTGQSIWDDTFEVRIGGDLVKKSRVGGKLTAEPGGIGQVTLDLQTPSDNLPHKIVLAIVKNGHALGSPVTKEVELIHPPSLRLTAGLGFTGRAQGGGFTLDLLQNNILQTQFSNLTFENGMAEISELHNVIPEAKYTFVLRRDYYLPKVRQTTVSTQRTVVDFGRLLPLDFDNNQQSSLNDLLAALKNPAKLLRLVNP